MKILKVGDAIVLLDNWDWLRLCRYKWIVKKCRSQRYIARSVRKNGKVQTIYMHRVIMDTPDNMECHHKDGNTFDNRTEMLENLTKSEHKKKDIERLETYSKSDL